MRKGYTKDGWLTPYAMGLGYIHRTEGADSTIRFARLECDGMAFEVEQWKLGVVGAICSDTGGILRPGLAYRKTYKSIAAARRDYKRLCGASLRTRFESNPDVCRSVIV